METWGTWRLNKIEKIRDIRVSRYQSTATDKFVTFSMMRINLSLGTIARLPVCVSSFFSSTPAHGLFFFSFSFFIPFLSIALGTRDEIDRDRAHIGAHERVRQCNWLQKQLGKRARVRLQQKFAGIPVLLSESRRFNQPPAENRWRNEREVRCRDVRKIAMPTIPSVIVPASTP